MSIRSFLLVRHGATKLNSDDDASVDRLRGWLDLPLSPEGRKSVERMADGLHAEGIKTVVSSDLERASDTAKILRDRLNIPNFYTTKGLRPWNVGKFAGQRTEEALPVLADYIRNKPHKQVPGGESFDDFRARGFDAVFKILRDHPDTWLAMVSHYRIERLLKAWKAAGCPANLVIDIERFCSPGEKTAHAEEMSIDLPQDLSTALREPEDKPAKRLPPRTAAALG